MSLLPTSQVAKRLNVSHRTVLKYIRKGTLTAIELPSESKHGKRYRISPEEVAAFLRRRSTLPRKTEAPQIIGPRVADPISEAVPVE